MPAIPRMCTIPGNLTIRLAALSALAVLAGCGDPGNKPWQGYVEGEFVNVASSQAGTLQTLAVSRGQQVKAGDPLFALESTYEQAAQSHARDTLANAEAQLRDLATGKRPDEIAVSSAQLKQAVAVRDKSVAQFDRDQSQYAAGGISREQLDASKRKLDELHGRIDAEAGSIKNQIGLDLEQFAKAFVQALPHQIDSVDADDVKTYLPAFIEDKFKEWA